MKLDEVDDLYRGGRYLRADDIGKPVTVAIESESLCFSKNSF